MTVLCKTAISVPTTQGMDKEASPCTRGEGSWGEDCVFVCVCEMLGMSVKGSAQFHKGG